MNLIRPAAAMFAATLLCQTNAYASDDAKLDAPPQAMTSSTAHLADVLDAHTHAIGKLSSAATHASVDTWSFTRAGTIGTEKLERSGSDYRSHIEHGPFVEEFGQFNGVRWHRDYNGFTTTTTRVEDESFLPLRSLADVRDPKNDVTLAGEVADPAAYVLKVMRPQYKHPEWVFIDKQTSLIDRVEYAYGKRRVASTYDDYRVTSGLNEPWHIHDSDGRTALDSDWHRTTFIETASIPPATFAPPHSSTSVASGFAPGIPSNTRMLRGDVIVRLSINGRGLDFLLDSGESESIIDADVARELNLPTFGANTKLDDGKPIAYETMVDDLTAGPLRLRHFAFLSERYNYDADFNTKVVGILGYDFLANTVLKIDYANGAADILPRTDFDKGNPIAASYAIPFTFDDGRPMVQMVIGNGQSQRVVINTAMPYTVVFGNYMDAHASDFTDDKNAPRAKRMVPFADENSFGSEATLWVAHAHHLGFGFADYQNFGVVATNVSYSFQDEDDVDALLGLNYLSFYDLYFDYPHDRIIIKPNDFFNKTFKKIP